MYCIIQYVDVSVLVAYALIQVGNMPVSVRMLKKCFLCGTLEVKHRFTEHSTVINHDIQYRNMVKIQTKASKEKDF